MNNLITAEELRSCQEHSSSKQVLSVQFGDNVWSEKFWENRKHLAGENFRESF